MPNGKEPAPQLELGLFGDLEGEVAVTDKREVDPEHPWGSGNLPVSTDISTWPTVDHKGRGVDSAYEAAAASSASESGGGYRPQPPTPASVALNHEIKS